MATTTDVPVPAPGPSANGELVNRVQQLRLDTQLGAKGGGSSRGSWLPWVLCGMMAVAWAGVGIRWYKSAGKPEESVASPGGAAKGGAAPAGTSPGEAQLRGEIDQLRAELRKAADAAGAGQKDVLKGLADKFDAAVAPRPAAPAGELLLQVKGTLTPFLQISLSPDDVSGVVERIHFKEGDRVVKGKTLLAEIRADRYRNDRDAAEKSLRAAEARYQETLPGAVRQLEKDQVHAEWEEAEAGRVRAEQEVQRLAAQKMTGVVSKQDIEKADADLRAAAARVKRLEKTKALLEEGPRREKVDAAKADMDAARVRLQEAERLLANCKIYAPINGTVLTKTADTGTLVSPMSFNVASGICQLADLSDMEVEIDVREDQISQIKPGQRCEVAAAADPTRVYAGRVDRVMPIADDTKNTVKVRVKVELPPKEADGEFFLKPKMSAVVRVYNVQAPAVGTK